MIAVCVGHSRPGDKGALSVGGITEHAYNLQLARMIAAELANHDLPATVIGSYQGTGYTAAMRWLAGEMRRIQASVAIELHFNSADTPRASGHEWLFWINSTPGRFLAQAMDRAMRKQFPALVARGIKSIHPGDRGGEFLRLTPCPALICEPFFGSNESDWQFATYHQGEIATVIANGLAEWIGGAK